MLREAGQKTAILDGGAATLHYLCGGMKGLYK